MASTTDLGKYTATIDRGERLSLFPLRCAIRNNCVAVIYLLTFDCFNDRDNDGTESSSHNQKHVLQNNEKPLNTCSSLTLYVDRR